MSHFDTITRAPDGFTAAAARADDAGGGARVAPSGRSTACSSTPRWCTRRAARRCCKRFLYDVCQAPADLDDVVDHRAAGRARSASRSAASGSSARCRAGSTPRSPPRSCTRPSVRSSPASTSTPASCARARATRWSRRSSAPGHRAASTCDAADRFFERARGRRRPRGEAQGHRRALHPRVRGRRRRHRGRPVPRAGHALPRRDRVGHAGRGPHQVAPQRGRAARGPGLRARRAAARRCSRTRCGRVGEELGLPEEIVWRQPFPGPGLGVRIIGEVTPERAAPAAHGRRHRARGGARRPASSASIWQVFAVLLADVRIGRA